MSHHIIKSLKLDDKTKTVWITGSDNNVVPHDYSRWDCESLSKIWRQDGKEAMLKEFLRAFKDGSFRAHSGNALVLEVASRAVKTDWTETYEMDKSELAAYNGELMARLYAAYLAVIAQHKLPYRVTFHPDSGYSGYYCRKMCKQRLELTSLEHARIFVDRLDVLKHKFLSYTEIVFEPVSDVTLTNPSDGEQK